MSTAVTFVVVVLFLVAALVGACAAYIRNPEPTRLDGELRHIHRSEP